MAIKTTLVVWTGPVAQFQIPDVTVPGADRLFLNCRGDKHPPDPYCPAVGAQFEASPDLLLQRAKLARDELGDLVFGAFSAGGSTLRRLFANVDYRALATAVMLSDATYTASWVNAQRREPPPIEPFVLFALDVLAAPGRKLLVATASPNPNGAWATGIENLRALRSEVERRSGRRFVELDHFYGIQPEPDVAYQLGDVIIAEYPAVPLGHGGHASTLASETWSKILLPFLQRRQGGAERPASTTPTPTRGDGDGRQGPRATHERPSRGRLVVAALAAAVAVLAVVLGGRRRRG